MTFRGWVVTLFLIIGAAAAAFGLRTWSIAQSLRMEKARYESIVYYRFKASYIVKATQERVDFDYVASCATIETTYKYGDRSVDTLGVNPKTFIKATRNGGAIQVWTPDACHGEVAEGLIPPDLFPFAILYDDVNDMSFGWGYASQDAYDSPLAQMSFEGPATLEAATYDQWKTWRTQAEAGFKPIGKITSPWGYSYEDQGLRTGIALTCAYYKKLPIVDAKFKAIIHGEWVKRGRPEFWAYDERMKKEEVLQEAPQLWAGIKYYNLQFSIPRTKHGGIGIIVWYAHHADDVKSYHYEYTVDPIDVYPLLPPWYVRTIHAEGEDPLPSNAVTIDLQSQYLGFVACGARKEDGYTFPDGKYKAMIYGRKQWVAGNTYRFYVRNYEITGDYLPSPINSFPEYIFHNDTYTLYMGGQPQGLFQY